MIENKRRNIGGGGNEMGKRHKRGTFMKKEFSIYSRNRRS
jgi:hypothetical protein